MQERRIGIMGGTFNPVHFAHLRIAECAREEFALDRVIFIPCGFPYLKAGDVSSDLPGGDLRYQLVKKAIQNHPYFTCSRIEIDREGNTYTADTLKELQNMYPGDTLYFILGADSLMDIEEWYNIDEIFSRATLLAAVRGDVDRGALEDRASFLKEKYGAKIEFLSVGRMDISSTDIRERIKSGRSVRYMMPDNCLTFITAKNFYGASAGDEEQSPDKVYVPKRRK